ncbi:MAG: hypothetical protein EOP35_18045 [Rubrivivax sp.]|nr:MAG: hypothetical protein EOP35_18045 [Rubrivivax sp.]
MGTATGQDPANRTWQIELLATQLAAQEAQTMAGRPSSEGELLALQGRLEELEQSGGPSLRLRRLPERARWARLYAGLASVSGERATALLIETRERLRTALQTQAGDQRLARSLALVDRAWLARTRDSPAALRDACDALQGDLRDMRRLLRVDPVVTAAWLDAQSCPGREPDAEVAQTRDWLSSRR